MTKNMVNILEEETATVDPTPKNDSVDENGGIFVRGILKIFDPESGEIIVTTSN